MHSQGDLAQAISIFYVLPGMTVFVQFPEALCLRMGGLVNFQSPYNQESSMLGTYLPMCLRCQIALKLAS